MKTYIELNTVNNRKLRIVTEKIIAFEEAPENAGHIASQVYVIGSEEPFNVVQNIDVIAEMMSL